MGVTDKKLLTTNHSARARLNVAIISAVSLTGAVVWSYTPGYTFQVTSVRSFCRVKAGVVTANVKVGTRTAAPIVFTSATELVAVLSTTLANIQGSTTEAITIELTTDGSGVLTNGFIIISTRPRPMNGEAQ